MKMRMQATLVALIAVLSLSQMRVNSAESPARETPPGLEALEYASRFASKITSDPKDRSKALQAVVEDFAAAGALQEATRLAASIEGWRRGIAYADLARALADAGDNEAARELIRQAEQVQQTITDWHGPRIAAHVALARAQLGELEASRQIVGDLAKNDRRQYQGQAAGTVAAAHAARGEYEQAMAVLRPLDSEVDLEITWSRTQGYLEAARAASLNHEQRGRALAAARRSADGVPGWKRIDALEAVARECHAQGDAEGAADALVAAEAQARSLGDSASKPALMTTVARTLARVGGSARARALLTEAERLAPQAMNIEQPEIYAYLASGYVLLGDLPEARRVYDLALSGAEGLVNARPRALAVVAVCRSLGQHGVVLTAPERDRLDGLFAGLGDPW